MFIVHSDFCSKRPTFAEVHRPSRVPQCRTSLLKLHPLEYRATGSPNLAPEADHCLRLVASSPHRPLRGLCTRKLFQGAKDTCEGDILTLGKRLDTVKRCLTRLKVLPLILGQDHFAAVAWRQWAKSRSTPPSSFRPSH